MSEGILKLNKGIAHVLWRSAVVAWIREFGDQKSFAFLFLLAKKKPQPADRKLTSLKNSWTWILAIIYPQQCWMAIPITNL